MIPPNSFPSTCNGPFLHSPPVSIHNETSTRLGWQISNKSLHFVHPSLELVALLSGRLDRFVGLHCKHGTKCFITRSNTKKRVENTTCSKIFFEELQGVWFGDDTLCQKSDISSQTNLFLTEKLRMQNEQAFIPFSKHSIFFAFSL